MRKKFRHASHSLWLPFDERLIPHIFSCHHVKGISRIFLGIEMVCATLVVLGTLLIVLLWAFQ